jgi:hypoxanthine phosphoribosyltransferase
MLEKIVLPVERIVLNSLGVNFVSMNYIDLVVANLVDDIREDRTNFRPGLVVGIANGGTYPSIKVAKHLHVDYELIEANRNKSYFCGLNLEERFILGRIFRPYTKTEPLLREELRRTNLPKNVLLVDYDCGTGKTLDLVKNYLLNLKGVERVKTACLFCYEGREKADYVGENILRLNSFMVGSKRLPWCDVSPHYGEYSKRLEESTV